MRKLVSILVASFVLIGVGCERRGNEQRQAILSAISATEAEPREFEYSLEVDGEQIVVLGAIRDDLAYQVRVTLNGQVVVEEAVVDDAHAVRIADPNALGALGLQLPPEALASEPLQQGQWVVDPVGSASLVTPERTEATDVILEALTSLRSTAAALAAAQEARVFNPEAPTYREDEDPFPIPDREAGVIRYDLAPPPIPPRQDPRTAQPGQPPPLPGPEHFRKMAIYIREGRIVQVQEVIEVDPRQRLGELSIRLEDAGVTLPEEGSLRQRIEARVQALNTLRQQAGLTPVILGSMGLRISRLDPGVTIALPADAVQGSLKGVLDRGQVLEQTEN